MTKFLFVDTETTGVKSDDEIVEVSIVDADGEVVFTSLVKPTGKTEWPEAQAIHGIGPEDVANAPAIGDMVESIRALCEGATVVMYNAKFDTRFFPADTFGAVECAMLRWSAYKGVLNERGSLKWHKLIAAANEAGHQWTGAAHRATADAQATATVWMFLEKIAGG